MVHGAESSKTRFPPHAVIVVSGVAEVLLRLLLALELALELVLLRSAQTIAIELLLQALLQILCVGDLPLDVLIHDLSIL